MQQLNLPIYKCRISEKDGRKFVFDVIRRKNVALTPEEWVRQHFVNYLISEKHYPAALIANEISITLNGTSKRCDTVVYNRRMTPIVIVEYKASDVEITETVFNQIARYNSVLRVPYLIVSNGMAHYCCHINYETMKYDFLKTIPDYEEFSVIQNAVP